MPVLNSGYPAVKIRLVPEISPKQMSWRNDPRVSAWTRQNGILTAIDMAFWLEKIANDPTIKMFGIEPTPDPERLGNVGTVGLSSISAIHRTAEFSILVDPDHHGKGYGSSALKALLYYGFFCLNLRLIWGESLDGNSALEMFKRIGMKYEGVLRNRYEKPWSPGQPVSTHMVSMERDEAVSMPWFDEAKSHWTTKQARARFEPLSP